MTEPASGVGGTRQQVDNVHDAIQAIRETPLRNWVAVAIWDEDGETTVIGDDTNLNLKGYLHSGIWAVAHAPEPEAETEPESTTFMAAADVRRFDKGRMDVVRLGGTTVGRGVFEPGFRWSECIKPIVGTESCQLRHVGFVLAGSMKVVMDDGEEIVIEQGQTTNIAPGHDAWTLGDKDCVILEVQGAETYALPS
jgi:hypothetical protein